MKNRRWILPAVATGLIALCGVAALTTYQPEIAVPDLDELITASQTASNSNAANSRGAVSLENGRYLATASNCTSCHTADAEKPFAGGVAFQTPFGLLYSTNITADQDTGIGSWSFADFYKSMKQGVRPNGEHLYPAYPYTAFAKMTDEDIASIYLYLQTFTPIAAETPQNQLNFPFNIRSLLGIWKTFFHSSATYVANPQQSEQWNRGAYLVEGPGHCGVCHSPRNILGAEQQSLALTGGIHMDQVKSGKYRQWSAVNLTPDSTGLAAWSEADIVSYLKDGQNNRAVVHGPMNEVIMNSTRHLTDNDAAAIATYLRGIPANAQTITTTASKETLAAGETVYTVHCGSCHLPTGLGDTILGVPLANNAIVQTPDPSSLINVILYGPHLPPPPFISDRSRMKMFGKRLSDKDIADVASYLRANFGNTAGEVTPEQVNAQR